jgi:hypothetical protein
MRAEGNGSKSNVKEKQNCYKFKIIIVTKRGKIKQSRK